MAERLTIELPEDLAEQVRTVAARTQRSFDEVLVDLLRRGGAEPVLELLPDEQLLAECDREPEPARQEELSDLLERSREAALPPAERARLDELMRTYRAGLVRKAQALELAVNRGLRPRLN
jgi:hypothetical protein